MKELIQFKKSRKAKKPKFIQQDGHKKISLAEKWRKPRGRHSKLRLNLRGYKRRPRVGWGSPAQVKGLHATGLEIILVQNVQDVNKLDEKKHGVIIGASVGNKKRLDVLDAVQKKNLILLNIKDIDNYKKNIQEQFNQRKEKRKKILEKKKEEKKSKEKKKEEKKEQQETDEQKKEEKKEQQETDEQKKEREKKEQDKLLTKRS